MQQCINKKRGIDGIKSGDFGIRGGRAEATPPSAALRLISGDS